MNLHQQLRVILAWLGSVYLLAFSTSVQAAAMDLAESPLFLGTQVSPNIFFMLDDSGSMDWEILVPDDYQYYQNYGLSSGTTDTVDSGVFLGYADGGDCTGRDNYYYIFDYSINTDNAYDSGSYRCAIEASPQTAERDWRIRSASFNILYYNPATTYYPWEGFDDAVFTAARSNPQPGSNGYSLTRDLTGFAYEIWTDNLGFDDDTLGDTAEGPDSVTDGANGMVDLWDSRASHTVNSSSIDLDALTTSFASVDGSPDCDSNDYFDTPPYVDCFGTASSISSLSGTDVDAWGRTYSDIQQNVANWYQYHRRRSMLVKGVVADILAGTTSNNRFGLSLINDYADLFREFPLASVSTEDFPAHNDAILQALYDYQIEGNGTPLRQGLERAGRYYADYYSGDYTTPITSSCQQNFSVLFTDGYWNGNSPLEAAISDEDGDGATDTLADVAHYFYNTDLSPLENEVPTSDADPNSEQHMVSLTVAFGVDGNLEDTDNDGLPNPELAENGAWNNGTVSSDPEKIDDLWHSAFNSKGTYVSANSSDGLTTALSEAVQVVADRTASAASVAVSAGSSSDTNHLYQAKFDSGNWQGQLLAYEINSDGSLDSTEDWDAAVQVDSLNFDTGREILSYNPDADVIPGGDPEGQGVPFRFPANYTSIDPLAEFSSDQVTALMVNAPFDLATVDSGEIASNQLFGDDLVDFLRGDRSNEGTGQDFRTRSSALGDIVNSAPLFVGVPSAGYADDMEAQSYDAFVSANSARDGVVYTGANDGMLHGFDESTGDEVLAYVPHAAIENLYKTSLDGYAHRYFVDTTANSMDVYMANTNGGQWRTVLVGGLGGGGQGIYALDITDPSSFDETNAASIVLWEFDDDDTKELGYTYGQPQLAKMADGSWAAVFGNGYNNTEDDGNKSGSGDASLFIVDVETGELIKRINTKAGDKNTPNGLATPTLVDTDGDFVVDYIYSGDLLGNVWKFDVSSSDTRDWKSDYKEGRTEVPIFTTENNQPITTQLQLAEHPDELGGYMVYFGTGQYLQVVDNSSENQTTQAFYGIWDKDAVNLTAFDSSDLLVQSITNQYAEAFDTDNDQVDDTTFTLRDVTDEEIDWDTHLGWKIDLIPGQIEGASNTNNFGERQVSNAVIYNERIIFTTLLPSTEECEYGGDSFLMELDFRNGGQLDTPAFDLNGDGQFDADDGDASGRSAGMGIMPAVSVLSIGGNDILFASTSSGEIDSISLSVVTGSEGRQSWRILE